MLQVVPTGVKCIPPIFYKLGEIEERFLGNKETAKTEWEKAVTLSSDSRWGKLAKERLNK